MNGKILLQLSFLFLLLPSLSNAQIPCKGLTLNDISIDLSDPLFIFPDIGGGDIANAGTPAAGPFDFDIIDEYTGALTPGGDPDLTISFKILPTFDAYGGQTIGTSSVTHDIKKSPSGLKGSMVLGKSGATAASTGDVRCYSITLQLADHMIVTAENFNTLINSANTPGEAFESTSVVFIDKYGANLGGTADYTGFYSSPPTGIPAGTNPPTISSNPWSSTGTGVYLAENTGVIDVLTDVFNPVAATSVQADIYDPNAMTDGGLQAGIRVGGVVYTVCFEDVAATQNDGDITTTSSTHSSTINGFFFSEICIEPELLDIELANFQGEARGCAVDLSWTTLGESGAELFEIQKSTNGADFRTIYTLEALGVSNEAQTYTFTDANAGDGSYYRLQIKEENEQYSYSDILMIRTLCYQITDLYPNPVKEQFTLGVSNIATGISTLIFSDALGRTTYTTDYDFKEGYNSLTINAKGWPNGLYFLRVVTDNKITKMRNFVKAQ